MGPSAGLDKCGKSRLHRDSIPRPSSPQPVAITAMLPDPHSAMYCDIKKWMSVPVKSVNLRAMDTQIICGSISLLYGFPVFTCNISHDLKFSLKR